MAVTLTVLPSAVPTDPAPRRLSRRRSTFDGAGKLTDDCYADDVRWHHNDRWTTGFQVSMVNGVWTTNGAKANPDGIAVNMGNITQYNSASYRNPHGHRRLRHRPDHWPENRRQRRHCSPRSATSRARPSARSPWPASTTNRACSQSGGTTWKETFASGQPGYDTPQTGTLGSIVANSLENSNVNLTNELVDLIKAQSNYQANAKTISTQAPSCRPSFR